MSLISLLIALTAERYLSSTAWQFNTYFVQYIKFVNQSSLFQGMQKSSAGKLAFIFLPTLVTFLLLRLIDDSLLHLIVSTLLLIVCFGCVATRECYKNYLLAAFRGENTTCELHHSQLTQDKNLPAMGFGQTLIWLNYRYYIAIMIFFVLFGATGAIFYRLLTTVIESRNNQLESEEQNIDSEINDEDQESSENLDNSSTASASVDVQDEIEADTDTESEQFKQILFWLDWLPVRITSFGYMLVGHFSNAMPVWLENLFAVTKEPNRVLVDVAEKSEDLMVDAEDCTAEPCLLVRLAKRNLLLIMALISVLTLSGVIS